MSNLRLWAWVFRFFALMGLCGGVSSFISPGLGLYALLFFGGAVGFLFLADVIFGFDVIVRYFGRASKAKK